MNRCCAGCGVSARRIRRVVHAARGDHARAGRGAGTGTRRHRPHAPSGVSAPSLHFETLLSEPVLIALPASHRLAECDVVELAALREDAFVASARTLGRAFMTSWCRCAWRRVSRRAWRRKRGGWRRWWRWWPAVSARPCYRPRWRGSRAAMWCSGRSRWKRRTLRRLDLLLAWRAGDASPIRDSLIAALREATRPVGQADTA